jgi:predicted nucleotidyltransferase
MTGPVDKGAPSAGAGGPVPEWRRLIDEMRGAHPNQFLRISRKMLNHLCSVGLTGAQKMLAEVEGAAVPGGANVPGARVKLEDSPLMTGAPFELADQFLGGEEITERIHRWIKEDTVGFFGTVVGDPRSTMPDIAAAVHRYHDMLRGRSGLPLSTLKSLRVSLIQRFLTEQLDYINVAKEVVRITDFHDLLDHVIMTTDSHGKLGGKAAGLLLARWILQQPEAIERGSGAVKVPRTWSILSDGVMDFIKLNELDDVMDQKFKEISQVRREYPNMIQLFKNSTFPPEITAGLERALDYFGETPLIIRSSSLLEDRFGTAFSGKYKSLFLANQGPRKDRLEALEDAVAEVWASILGPDPIEYRRERGLTEFIEEMGILVQEVVGTRVGRWWLPAFAGVGFSLNEFRWSPRIEREDGLIRLVPGLGTRAVDRVGDDFPILAVPGQPGLRSNASVDEVLRYSPQVADVINLETNRFESVDLADLLREAGDEYPLVDKIFSVYRDGMLNKTSRFMMDPTRDDLVADMQGLLADTDLIPKMHALMTTLANYLGTPVDIEFAHDGEDFFLLQCRPQAMTGESAPAPIPRDIDPEKVVFSARKFVSNGWVPDISHIVYVVPEEYGKLATVEQMKEVGRVVGRLNATLPKRKFILMGPGRWGSRGDIKLGVSVTYADLNNTAMLIEVARRTGNYVPDLSFGTHFFQDLVEAQIRYLPLYPDEQDVAFHEDFLLGSHNLLAELFPESADLAACVRVIDVPAVTGGQVLRVYLNADLDEAVALLDEGGVERVAPSQLPSTGEHEPLQFWRWRFRMAERMVRAMDAPRFGVAAVYLFGSVKNGTATPESDINLLVHFQGDEKQREMLDHWFRGWSQALTEMNYSRTGVRVPEMLDVHYLTDEEVDAGEGLAAKINAVTDAARMLKLS